MRNIKKLMCLVISLLMLVSTVSVFAAFSDVPTTASYEKAVSALSQLGIIKGYEDGTFKPDNDVTRAEFTAMLMRTMGAGSIGSPSSADLPFSDVSDQNSDISWAIPNINTAYKNGIVNGYDDGTFRPSDRVLYEEAVKMIVCALGYGSGISVDVMPWYSNFIAQARTLGILKNAQNLGDVEKPASRACIAQMLYDSLEVSLIENGVVTTKTFLADYLGYIKNTGYISANAITSLEDPDVNLRENQIQIRAKEPNSNFYEVHTYSVDNSSEFTNKLGYQIDYFYPKTNSNDAVRALFSYEIKANTALELTSKMIDVDSSTNSAIKYYQTETSSLSSTNLASDNIVIYNGKLYGSSAASSTFNTSILPNVGTVSLLDSDKDGKYDVITIWDYELYYVSTKSSVTNEVVDIATRVSSKLQLDIDKDEYLEIVDKNGSKVSFSAIANGSVVCYAESNYIMNGGQDYKRAVVVTDKATGTISSTVSGDEMKVNGTTYKYSEAAPWMPYGNDGNLEEPSTGDSGTYALDILGNVFAYNKNAENVNQAYAYVLAYDEGESAFGTIDDFRVRILTQNNTKVDYGIRKGTTVNGKSCTTAYDFLEALREGASYQNTGYYGNTDVQQVIKFTETTYQGKKCLDSVYTVTADTDANGGHDVVSDKLYNFANLKRASVPVKYSYNKLTGTGVDINVSSSIVFIVPEDSDRNDADSFKKVTASSYFTNNRTYDSVEAFDVSKGNAPKVIVVYGESAVKGVDDSSPLFVLDEAPGNEHNSDIGENMYRASGYKITKSNSSSVKATTEWVSTSSNSVMKNTGVGDVYRIGEDSDGYKTFERDYKLYPSSQGYLDTGKSKPANWNSAEFCTIYGSVYSANSDDGLVVLPEVVSSYDDVSNIDQYTIAYSRFSGAKILLYDESGSKTKITEIPTDAEDRKAVFDTMDSYSNDVEPSRVLVYMSEGNVRLLVVITD